MISVEHASGIVLLVASSAIGAVGCASAIGAAEGPVFGLGVRGRIECGLLAITGIGAALAIAFGASPLLR
jgi:hypothetical protein